MTSHPGLPRLPGWVGQISRYRNEQEGHFMGNTNLTITKLNRGILVVLFVCMAASWALSQLPTATILGVVKDSTGAVVPEVTLSALNLENGQSRTAISAGDGSFRFAALPVGNYEVR